MKRSLRDAGCRGAALVWALAAAACAAVPRPQALDQAKAAKLDQAK